MRAVVIFESMYGNTHEIADTIGAGLRTAGVQVSIVPVAAASSAVLTAADLVVVGGPTHAHGMTRPSTREGAAEAARKPGSGLILEADALGAGLRDWLDSLGHYYQVRAAAFDTRIAGPSLLTGRASRGIARALRHHGFEVLAEPESFMVSRDNHIVPGERERARQWGADLAAAMAAAGARPTH
jgi:hypothetical protein